jgi:hypothetical protein
MKTTRRFVATAIAYSLSLLASTSALAGADIVLRVPLDVKYLDEGFPSALVKCEVSAVKAGTRTVIGSGVSQIAPNANTGTLPVSMTEVAVTVTAGNDPLSADHYRCQLYLAARGITPEVPIDCTNQSFYVLSADAIGVGAFKTGAHYDASVRDMTKPCQSIVEGVVSHP